LPSLNRALHTFFDPRHHALQRPAQPLGVVATPQNASSGHGPVQVFKFLGASPIAYKAEMIPDGSAGRGLHGTSASAPSSARVQRLDAAGAEVFTHNGVEIYLEANRWSSILDRPPCGNGRRPRLL
jgi:hypothetical protein